MITISQIKAARALLGWRQEDLAQKSGLSLAAINKLERDLVSPRKFTLDLLQQAFERDGIEFTEGPGVRMTDNIYNLQTFTGKDAPIQMLDDVFNTLKGSGQEVSLSGVDESMWDDYADYLAFHVNRLKENNIPMRILMQQGDTNFFPGIDPATQYRWISKELFTQMLYYVYADKFAMVLWGKPIRITIIQNKLIADTFRKQFEMNWKNGKLPEVKTK
jgi:transcriptional regulator with XRE-family HTH domain